MLKKFNPAPEPPPSRQQVADLFAKGDFHAAEKARKRIRNSIENFQSEFDAGVRKLVLSHQSHQVLSFLYNNPSLVCPVDVPTLLRSVFQSGNYSAFLKEAERFALCSGLEAEIQAAIDQLISKGQLPQAAAYKRRFSLIRAAHARCQ